MKIKSFSDLPNYEGFFINNKDLLAKTISEFLSVEVEILICKPQDILKAFNIDISKNINQSCYKLDETKCLLISTIEKEDIYYFIGILLQGKALKAIRNTKILNFLAGTISKSLEEGVHKRFLNTPILLLFNENLIQKMIVSLTAISRKYNPFKLSFLIDQMKALMSTTFEGKHFSSGLIVTKSYHEYEKGEKYEGKLLTLNQKYDLLSPINNRFWYLVDGVDSFYLSGLKDMTTRNMYLSMDTRGVMQKMTPHKFLRGADCIFRVYNGREVSVITKDEMEFIYQENVWRFRDYVGLKKVITEDMTMNDYVYDSFISYILYCSKNEISSIIWIPSDDDNEELDKMVSTSNSIEDDNVINICNEAYQGMLMRMLSSDGACIFNRNGDLLRYGCIIKTHSDGADVNQPEQKVKGTGESAASLLASNGIAFKISQDGTIKFYHAKNEVIKI